MITRNFEIVEEKGKSVRVLTDFNAPHTVWVKKSNISNGEIDVPQIKEQIARNKERDAIHAKFLTDCKELVLSGQVIETNVENLEKVIYGLNQMNWGSWTLPVMTIGYRAHQYDCDGETVTTIQLDRPIKVDVNGKLESKFKTFSPMGHLDKYYRL